MVTKDLEIIIEEIDIACRKMTSAGQKEYAHSSVNVFANFERVAERLEMSREKILMVYLEKHLDGIHSFLSGHRSQREPVYGRLVDALVYLKLLYAMINENDARGLYNTPVQESPKGVNPSIRS